MHQIHKHAGYGPCRTVCGLDCDGVDISYAHDDRAVTCEDCKLPDTSRQDYLKSVTA